MLSFVTLALLGLVAAYAVHNYLYFARHLAQAKRSGFPYVCLPIYPYNTAWLITHRLWLPLLRRLPERWTVNRIEFLNPEFMWSQQYDVFKRLRTDTFIIVSPGANTLCTADAEACAQITSRRNDFPKPTHLYTSVDLYGKNVVSSEGATWRHHRKITSPPFNEQSNRLVWAESLQQAQSMMAGFLPPGKRDSDSGTIMDVAIAAMRLSLHVISAAGFGQHLLWPHEDPTNAVPPGHTMTFQEALHDLLQNLIVIILTPRFVLRHSPLQLHKSAWGPFVEWGKYMREMLDKKLDQVESGQTQEGLDLMGALVNGAGITSSDRKPGPNKSPASPKQRPKQLITDDEILGNAFVFIIAGHETTANTIHYASMFLAMYPRSQRRLQKDLDAILGDRPVSAWDYDEDMPRLFGGMCGAVMNEELRLIPPVVGIPKCTLKTGPQPLQLNGQSFTVPEDCYVTLDTAATHRNPKYWPHTSDEDLLRFRPERWLLDEPAAATSTASTAADSQYEAEPGLEFDQTDKRPDTASSLFRPPKGAFIPFSDGYRSCLGRRFAQVEIMAVLAVMYKTWSVELDVSEWLPDDRFEAASEQEKKEAWEKASAKATHLLKHGMMTIITIQMRAGTVPLRFVKRGHERFKDHLF